MGVDVGGFIKSSELLIYGSYFNASLLGIKVLLFLLAEFIVYPKSMEKLSFYNRVRVSLIPIKDEEAIFADEIDRLKIYRRLWFAIFTLLIVRVIVAILLSKMDFSDMLK